MVQAITTSALKGLPIASTSSIVWKLGWSGRPSETTYGNRCSIGYQTTAIASKRILYDVPPEDHAASSNNASEGGILREVGVRLLSMPSYTTEFKSIITFTRKNSTTYVGDMKLVYPSMSATWWLATAGWQLMMPGPSRKRRTLGFGARLCQRPNPWSNILSDC